MNSGYLENKFDVVGFDVLEAEIKHEKYTHYIQNICDDLPEIENFDIIISKGRSLCFLY